MNDKVASFLRWWLPVFLWCGVIYTLSAIPHLRLFKADLLDFVVRKTAHMVEYGVLARLLARAFTGSTLWSWKKIFAWSLALAILYACTDEYHQTFVAGRHGTPRDVGFDSVGAWVAMGLKP
jgi:VanZ family protein